MERLGGEGTSYAALDGLARVPFDDALDALGHRRRRTVLFELLNHDPEVDPPVVPADTEGETDRRERLVETNHVHPSNVETNHVNLPKLVEYGFVDWDRDSNEVVSGEGFGEIEPLLDLLADHEDELPDGWL